VAFHVQLSRGLFRSSQLFNLEYPELEARILRPWRAGAALEIEDKLWPVAESKVIVLEGPALAPSLLGVGQGWRAALRQATDVTEQLIGAAPAGVPAPPPPAGSAAAGAPEAERRRVVLGGGPDRRVLDSLAALLFALGLEPVPWREGLPARAHALLVAVGPGEDGAPDAAALVLAGVAAGLAPGRALALEAGATVPAPAQLLSTITLAADDAAPRIARWLEAVGCPVRRDDGWDDPARFR
jgi:hypothetical protein